MSNTINPIDALFLQYFGDISVMYWTVQPLYSAHVKENVSKASAKHAGVGDGGWWGLRTKQARTNREAVDIFGKS